MTECRKSDPRAGLASGVAALVAFVCLVALHDTAASEPDLELGEYLAAECTGCHRADAINQGIPTIYGMPPVLFAQAMAQYLDGTRSNEIMRNVARSLSEEDIDALAAYLEQASLRKR